MKEYLTAASEGSSEYIEKKSRFLGRVFPVETEEQAKALLESVRKEHYDARHHCWCYILKDGAKRYSDDGEPQGTAGQPMLAVFEREGIENVLCVVTRYFGGILLGTGGLCRAYTKAAKDALTDAGILEMRAWEEITVPCPYALFERVKLTLAAHGGIPEDTQYGAEILLSAMLPEEKTEALSAALRELSAGKITISSNGKTFCGVLRENS